MPLKIWNGSIWNQANRLKVWNGSAWTDCQYGKVWNGSSWVEFYTGYTATLNSDAYLRSVNSPASFQVNTDGYIYASSGLSQLVQQYQWRTGIGSSSDYEVKADLTSGTPTGSAFGTWLGLGTNATWSQASPSGTLRIAVIEVSIRVAATSVVIAGPVTITIECDRS